MNMFLISMKGKFNILVKISDLQNFISYSKYFLVYEILPFYKVIVFDNFECCTEGFSLQKAVNIYLRRY